jgi:hypothetical protein
MTEDEIYGIFLEMMEERKEARKLPFEPSRMAFAIKVAEIAHQKGFAAGWEDCKVCHHNSDGKSLAAALRAAAEQVIPEETEAPKAEFDCPPRKLYNFGKKEEKWGYEHSDYMRRQFAQDKLDIQWEERQSIRSKLLTLIQELENLND